jgi:hypothetical protein
MAGSIDSCRLAPPREAVALQTCRSMSIRLGTAGLPRSMTIAVRIWPGLSFALCRLGRQGAKSRLEEFSPGCS